MSKCSLKCGRDVIYARTAASLGKKSMAVNAQPVPNGTAWFEKMTDHKGKESNLLVVASGEHPRPETGRFFRLHSLDCGPYKAKKEIEAALKRADKKSKTEVKE